MKQMTPQLNLLTELCSIPTAPFAEHRVLDWIDHFAAANQMRLSKDRFGNRLLEIGPASSRPRLVFVAHTDHPGMVAEGMLDRTTLRARFHGGVLSSFVVGSKVRFFADNEEVAGHITRVTRTSDRADFPAEVAVRVAAPVAAGSVGMFDQGTGRTKSGRFYSRVCDDLAGAAAVLAAMQRVQRRKVRTSVCALLTRAEEEGFIGAIAAVKDKSLLRANDRLISVECSAVQPYARQGNGVILRVGDRISIFNSAFSYWISQQCEALAKEDRSFTWQRSLMPGGACEGTVFDINGYCSAAMCVPLGNYHNMNRATGKIGPEYIDLNDWKNEVKAFVRLAEHAHEVDMTFASLRARLDKRFKGLKKLLR